jgi:NADH-quinone oxidoreductase subunit L
MNLLATMTTDLGALGERPICAVWLTLFAPLVAAALITLFTRRWKGLSAALSIGAIVLGFVLSLRLFVALAFHGQQHWPHTIQWLVVGNAVRIEFGMTTDPLAILMLLVVTGVGSAIHIYSLGYMKGDPGFSRYFACMSLFTFSMLGIVLSNNFIQIFIFWELVGLSSYLLIGYWFEKHSAAEAGKKAFLVNRIGDFGMMLGILLLWSYAGTFNFRELQAKLPGLIGAPGGHALPPATITLIGALIFCGAVGKSAQVPLHVWLPDAMEGPTPVSALIHAATMVAAGVYMLCRVVFLFGAAPAWPASLAWLQGISALDIIAYVGGFTALLAAVIAVQQDDIKRILAYSTLSQLGYMVMAVGVSPALASPAGYTPHDPTAAMYHLGTHAFFKALLFLGAGSVIIALHHEQNIWKMGGLKRKMPVTYWTFLAGTMALAGVPGFSGFYSKDDILASAYQTGHVGLFVLGAGVALLTSFYMFRLVFVAFHGNSREEAVKHAHESPPVMTSPLVLLAIPSVLAGLWGLNTFLEAQFNPEEAQHALSWAARLTAPFSHAPLAAIFSLAAVAFGFSFAYGIYGQATADPIPGKFPVLARAMRRSFYFDEIYQALINVTHEALARLAAWSDRRLLDGFAVRGLSGGTEVLGRALRLLQTGNLQTYAFLVVLGVAVVLLFFLR